MIKYVITFKCTVQSIHSGFIFTTLIEIAANNNEHKNILYIFKNATCCPVKNLSSQLTHIETHRKLILRTLSYLTVNSQDDSHCEVALGFPFYNSHSELAVSYL